MLSHKGFAGLGALILTLSLALGAMPLQAATACKGLGSSACQKNSNCSWVKDYVRKDGVKVSGYCKSKPARSGSSADKKTSDSARKPKDKSSSTKKSSDKSKSDSKKKSGSTKKSSDKSKSDGKK